MKSNQFKPLDLDWTLIIVDGSFCPKNKVAGYGYHIASKLGKERGGDKVNGLIRDSLNTEMFGIIRAIEIAVQKQLVLHNHNILLQCDCLGAWDFLAGFRDAKAGSEREALILEYRNLLRQHKLSVIFRHVKGHCNGNDPRFVANRKCDEIAKHYMNIRRREIKHEQR